MDKSFVSLEKAICPICNKEHNFNCGIVIDEKLQPRFNRETITHIGMCEEHQKYLDNGYIYIIEIDESKSSFKNNNKNTLSLEDAYKTGRYCMLKKEIAIDIFDKKDIPNIIFSNNELMDQLENMYNKTLEEN